MARAHVRMCMLDWVGRCVCTSFAGTYMNRCAVRSALTSFPHPYLSSHPVRTPIDRPTIPFLHTNSHQPSLTQDKNTALIFASRYGCDANVNKLLEKSPKLDVLPNNGGFTALMWACWNDNTNIIKTLVNAGADLNIQNQVLTLTEWGAWEGFRQLPPDCSHCMYVISPTALTVYTSLIDTHITLSPFINTYLIKFKVVVIIISFNYCTSLLKMLKSPLPLTHLPRRPSPSSLRRLSLFIPAPYMSSLAHPKTSPPAAHFHTTAHHIYHIISQKLVLFITPLTHLIQDPGAPGKTAVMMACSSANYDAVHEMVGAGTISYNLQDGVSHD